MDPRITKRVLVAFEVGDAEDRDAQGRVA